MKKIHTAEATITSFALLLTLSAVPESLAAAFKLDPVLAQSASTLPVSPVSNGQTIRIDGSSSMKVTNEIRQQQLERRSPNANVEISYDGSDAALQSVLSGDTDLAAVGRPLTPAEKAQGFVVSPQDRRKIAIVVSPDNPFTGNLTFDQFAKIFRGEITDWSEVGGPRGRIQLVDRPNTNDTRRALQNYDIFQQAPFVAAPGAVKLSNDSTEAMIERLGSRSISYAIADQVTDTSGVRIVPMHRTLPSDPRYPFSQPLAYVYKEPASAAAAAFLGLVATAPAAASPEATAPTASVPAVSAPAASAPAAPIATPAPQGDVAPVAAQAGEEQGFPWWILLLPLLGGLLWWALKRSRPAGAIAPVAAPVAPIPPAAPVTPVVPVAPAAPVVLAEPPDVTLYEERLVAGTTRQKVGDVAFAKHVETEQAHVSVPIEKERVVIEKVPLTEAETVLSGDVAFGVGEARIETYEETADIRKEAFVREEVRVHKEIEQETVIAEETIRREELDISTEGHPAVDETHSHRNGNGSSQ